MIALCYEVLNKLDFRINNGKLALYEGVPHFETGIPSEKYKSITGYYEENICEWCGTDYLKKDKIRHNCCSDECKKNLAGWNKEWKYREKRIEGKWNKAKRVYQGKLAKIKRQKEINRYFELRKKTNLGPLYDNYSEILDKYYEIRRAPDDIDFLEIKCAYCDKWFKPTKIQVQRVLPFVNGESAKKYSTTFYCCNEHRVMLRNQLAKIKYEKTINDTTVELLMLPEIELKRKYFKKNFKVSKKRENHFKNIKGTYKPPKELKMPTDPEERKMYASEKAKANINKLKKEDPRKLKIRRLLYYSKVRAKEKNISHSINKKWLKEKLEEDKCELTGLPFSYDLNIPRNPYGPSIDRIDINKGYTSDNCRLVIWAVNAGLGHHTEIDLYRICKAYLLKHNLLN